MSTKFRWDRTQRGRQMQIRWVKLRFSTVWEVSGSDACLPPKSCIHPSRCAIVQPTCYISRGMGVRLHSTDIIRGRKFSKQVTFPRYDHFSIFQDGGCLSSWVFISSTFLLPVWFGGPMCVTVPNFVPIGQTVAEIWPFFDFFWFQNGGHPPYWICFTQLWTTLEEYLVIFVTLQTLAGIGMVLWIICKF